MIESFSLGDLEKEYLDLVEEIYFKGNSQCMKGGQAKRLAERLQKGRDVAAENERVLLDLFAKKTTEAVEEFSLLKQRVLESFVSARKP